jgi:hypothetical protein
MMASMPDGNEISCDAARQTLTIPRTIDAIESPFVRGAFTSVGEDVGADAGAPKVFCGLTTGAGSGSIFDSVRGFSKLTTLLLTTSEVCVPSPFPIFSPQFVQNVAPSKSFSPQFVQNIKSSQF